MRVVYLSPVGVIGGAERVLLTLIDAMAASGAGVQPVVITLADGPLVTELRLRNVETIVVPLSAGLQSLGDSGGGGVGQVGRLLMALPALAGAVSAERYSHQRNQGAFAGLFGRSARRFCGVASARFHRRAPLGAVVAARGGWAG